jgi:GntR family transcriptional repressor for pyruvate dehydrogenase complex
MAAQRSAIVSAIPGRSFFPGRSASLSAQIIGDVRDALFAKKLKPGDVLGTENEIAARYGVSRIVARDALRTLEALGIAEIRMGKGGGARVARGNPRLFAEALAVQLDLTGVTPAEIMDAQRAIECLAAELAAENATEDDIARLRGIVADSEASLHDAARFTELGAAFHAQGAPGADRDPRRRRRAPDDGRPRQDDPRPPGVGACAIEAEDHRLLLT